ncbi:MAG: glycosyltransferase [Methanobrevibacter boviskoreani]|uniref:glycosyltransferase family 2 protein n=1 Tax=Methanobrevibacter boviskoreani TaxID=1348249 RepID=UPI0023A8AB1B|nr:glycosyltransferase family 2 protein [Methanobrevibacter boviskoreani]MCI6930300.1 glycosyltransferase [Methanobrevibacter boviskoreani]
MVKVSVIIPIYNVENYLEECLDSIVNQTLKDIEIICVNDGSTDNSLDIINKYAAKDDRIIVIDQENGGHAVATNRGMDLAKGKYLYLMDSDDFVKTDALEKSYKLAEEKQVDFVLFQAINYDDDNDIYYKTEDYSMNKVYNKVKDNVFSYKDLDGDLSFGITVTPWTKLYNRKFVEDCGARFPEGLIFEDNVFFWEVFFAAKKICFLKDHLFYRRWHGNSSTRAGDQRFMDSYKVVDLVIDVFKENNMLYGDYERNLFNKAVRTNYNRFKSIQEDYKQSYLDGIRETYNSWINNKVSYDEIVSFLYRRNKFIFDTILENDNPLVVRLSVENFDLKNTNKKLLSSRSWKMTAPMRRFRNRFR